MASISARGCAVTAGLTLSCSTLSWQRSKRLRRIPEAGETLATTGYSVGLGGKGANQAIAAAASDAEVRFIGAIGDDCPWTVKALEKSGVDVAGITIAAEATGHAIIFVEPSGENRIVIHGGAN